MKGSLRVLVAPIVLIAALIALSGHAAAEIPPLPTPTLPIPPITPTPAPTATPAPTPNPATTGCTSTSCIYGRAFDASTGAPLSNICVILGPVKLTCFTRTDANGNYHIDFPPGNIITAAQQLEFLDQSGVYQEYDSPQFVVVNQVPEDAPMLKPGQVPQQPCTGAGAVTRTIYLPNITKDLGGAGGWYTPFIVQNTGSAVTRLEISYYKFSDGSLVSCRAIPNLAPGTSFADDPRYDAFLPTDSQFAVVVRSFGSTVVSVVNEHQHSGDLAEAMSYDGASSGSTTVFLPNVTRRFFGYDTPIIMQNLGTAATTATAHFVSFDGTAPTIDVIRNIDVGRSQFIDPNYEAGLVDGKQYGVTVTANQPLSVVVNVQDDQSWQIYPKGDGLGGISTGGSTLYAAYAPKNMDGVGRSATVVVQNMGTTAASPSIAFTPFGGGSAQTFALGAIQPGGSRAFDVRYANGDTSQPLCSSGTSGCLGDGDYSVVISGAGANLAAEVNVNTGTTAMNYVATATPAAKSFLPNVTRTLGGSTGWTTPIVIQSASASTVTLSWYRFSDGALVTTQVLTTSPGVAMRVDPRGVSGLSDDTQYSVVADGGTGLINGIVVELASAGDNAMIYEGFTAP